jgi:hypothetical protein
MIVLHPTQEQFTQLNGYKHNSSELLFVKDGNDKFIIGLEVLSDENFSEIYDKLNQLERIEYVAFIPSNFPPKKL